MKYKPICPTCFADTSHSVVMEEESGVFQCPKSPKHRFTRNADGFYKKVEKTG